jgi:hypothetical protein
MIAAGLNIPYELLLKDFSKTNYSSARAALLEAWRFFRGRRKWLISYWCQPFFELWLEEEVMQGRIEAPDFYEKRALYCRTKLDRRRPRLGRSAEGGDGRRDAAAHRHLHPRGRMRGAGRGLGGDARAARARRAARRRISASRSRG